MTTSSVKFNQSMDRELFDWLNGLATAESKTRADLLEEAVMLLQKERDRQAQIAFHDDFISSAKPLLNKSFKLRKMKKINFNF